MKLYSIETGKFKLDGGAMFGVVPKTMWSKLNPPDDNNMCTWAMRCLLIEYKNKVILIDTGMGSKQDEKFRSHFHPHGEDSLLQSIQKQGFSADQITDVILTHLHFDHCGGAVQRDGDRLVPQFKNATYWSHKSHWNWALKPNDRERASFLKENILPLEEAGQLAFLEKNSFRDFNIEFEFLYGHTEAMTIPIIDYHGKTIIYPADLIPSSFHIPMPYIMSYDLRPLDTLSEKEKIYKLALERHAFFLFEHDPIHEMATISQNEMGKIQLDQYYKLNELK